MLSFSDQSYQLTKRVKQGKGRMHPDFSRLAQWIDKQYGVKTINILHDTINNGEMPRLQICFEFEWEEEKFLNRNRSMDSRKQQAIAREFTRIADDIQLPYRTKDLWVIYGAFEPIAKTEAMSKIPKERINQLQQELDDQNLWLIMATSLGIKPGFFLFTDEQVKSYTGSEVINKWADRFYGLLKEYDEFGYISREHFSIYLDSKENFDTNYQSNWYYYFK